MDLGLAGARALVGGGSGGLGGAIAAALTGEGARVGLVARPSERLDAAVGRLAGAVGIAEDLSTEDGPARAVAGAVEALGGLDLLLVNSGGPPPGTFDELDEAAWQRAIDGTLWSSLRLIRSALPHLRASDRPAILIILSSSAREPIPGLTTSNLLRPGLAGLVKSLTAEIAPVRINGIAPGRVATDRIAQIDAAAAAAHRLDPGGDRHGGDRADPARPLRRSGRGRAAGGLPAVSGRVVRDRRDRPGRRRDDPEPALMRRIFLWAARNPWLKEHLPQSAVHAPGRAPVHAR